MSKAVNTKQSYNLHKPVKSKNRKKKQGMDWAVFITTTAGCIMIGLTMGHVRHLLVLAEKHNTPIENLYGKFVTHFFLVLAGLLLIFAGGRINSRRVSSKVHKQK